MSALALLQGGGTPNWVEVIVVVLLLFGGGIQAIFRALRDKAEKAKTQRPPSADEEFEPSAGLRGQLEGKLESGLERWRELARGGAPPVAVPPPVPPEPRRRPRPRRPQAVESEPVEESSMTNPRPWAQLPEQGAFAAFGGGPSELELERRLDEDRSAERQLVASHHRGPARVREGVPLRTRLRNRNAWRAAIVSAEVLGRPVGLRRPEELPGNAAR